VHRVDSEDDRHVQARVRDRVALQVVVVVGPAGPGVRRRIVAAAHEDRAGVVRDEHGLLVGSRGRAEDL